MCIGYKELLQESGRFHQTRPLCVLDFYVHESCQRSGIGRMLFEAMLRHQGVHPIELAYDRPSLKLIAFLRKHYAAAATLPQANNFVVFRGFLQYRALRNDPAPVARRDLTVCVAPVLPPPYAK